LTILLIVGGLLMLVIGGEALLRGSVSIGQYLNVSPIVLGIVIVGVGTSMPELFIGVQATLDGAPEIAVGNVIGSNIANVLLILGVAALINPITRPGRAVHPDGTILLIVSIGLTALGAQGLISWWQGSILVLIMAGLIFWEMLDAWRLNTGAAEADTNSAISDDELIPSDYKSCSFPMAVALALSGLVMLPFGADLLIDGASQMAAAFGVSAGLIGLTIVAIGTSLPELASVMVASIRGHSDLAYGNVVGSNLFNSLGIVGASAMAGPLYFPESMVVFDGPIMVLATFVMILLIWIGNKLSRTDGLFMLLLYAAYLTFRVIAL